MNEDCIQSNVAHGGGSVHVWDGIYHMGKPSVLDKNAIGAVYRRVLEEHLMSHGRAWYRNNWILPDDNARPHRARVVDVYFQEQDINPL